MWQINTSTTEDNGVTVNAPTVFENDNCLLSAYNVNDTGIATFQRMNPQYHNTLVVITFSDTLYYTIF